MSFDGKSQFHRRWAVILAGGEGTRLRPLTRILAGDDRPKQFCAVIGEDTLLQQTQRRVAYLVPADQTLLVVTKSHEPFFRSQLSGLASSMIVQPANRGTAAAILYSLLSLAKRDGNGQVAFFPADHYIANDAAFMASVSSAFQIIDQRPDLVVLLGIVPDGPEVEYGWIEPGECVTGVAGMAPRRVRRFWEKPTMRIAADLLVRGCLWSSFVTIGATGALLRLIQNAVPDLYRSFEAARPSIGTPAEGQAAELVYSKIRSTDFSRQVLSVCPDLLSVLPVGDAGWMDLGRPDRALAIRKTTYCAQQSVAVCEP